MPRRPLKQRFEVTEDTLVAQENAKPLAKWSDRDEAAAGAVAEGWELAPET